MEREITTHHDGHGLNESLHITADEAGPGGASHSYEIWIESPGVPFRIKTLARIQFQRGPRNEPDSTPGVSVNAVLAALIDHLEGFQSGDYRCRENAIVITKLEEAMHWVRHRADARAKRGVLGKLEK